MGEFTEKIKGNVKGSLLEFVIFLVRLTTGAFLGLTVALTAQNMLGFSQLVFMFIVISAMALIVRLTRGWGLLGSIILLLVFVLIGVLLKLYIHTAAIG